ncbi:VOC family protein [Parahaliea aestuarii]|uniref:VOC family protein n=1 Tax=Parahaliea aestuarii TaxID=1852021 RepID=A0A5C8ZVE5_9GAMM|nr:VOC family protein [Parahaliea aestuarii]TXS91724.1 VOC family protein [Parahaliea aestuarii]
MKIEHIAYNVSDPDAISAWYCEHLGMRVARRIDDAQKTTFLADSEGMMVEIYCNPPDAVPDYSAMSPLQLHLAFVSQNPQADLVRLSAAGATLVDDLHLPDGSNLVMMKDPWGFALQLCRRGPAA